MRLDDLFSCSTKYSRKNVREFRGTWMKTCLKAIRRNNHGKTIRDILVHTSDRSQPCCRAGTPLPVVVPVTTSPPTPTSRALIILVITKTESIKGTHVFTSSLVPQKVA